MDLKQLKAIGAFVPTEAEAVEIKWQKSEEEEIVWGAFIRRQSFGSFATLLDPEKNKDKLSNAELISKSFATDATGKTDLLTYDQAYSLDPNLAGIMVQAIWTVNTPKKKSVKKKSSGAKSSSPESAAEPSTKPSEN